MKSVGLDLQHGKDDEGGGQSCTAPRMPTRCLWEKAGMPWVWCIEHAKKDEHCGSHVGT